MQFNTGFFIEISRAPLAKVAAAKAKAKAKGHQQLEPGDLYS
jgi:hypothetical protein